MRKTSIDLYRQGNANSPRMDNVRPNKDILTYNDNGEIWVNPNLGGGVSTFAIQKVGKNWWKLDKETNIPTELELVNDHNDHWLWTPSYTMSLQKYKEALQFISSSFYLNRREDPRYTVAVSGG